MATRMTSTRCASLPGRKFILTNAPLAYAERVIGALGIGPLFDGVLSIEDMCMFGQLRPKPDVRMLRRVAVRLGVPPSRCVLVEDTLDHQKSARRIGMTTVWMQRWTRQAAKHVTPNAKVGVYLHRKPAYVVCKNLFATTIAQETPAVTPELPDDPADAIDDEAAAASEAGAAAQAKPERVRKRPKPGERRVQILQTLAQMLEQPGADRITTAALAAKLSVSEAALYRHFASKAQMFEGLIEFIESSVFSLINQIVEREPSGAQQAAKMLAVVLQFGEKNPGMTRVMVGDALVFENERLIARMNQFFDRVESQLRQSLRAAAEAAGSPQPTVDGNAQASALTAFAVGRLQRYARSGFKRSPTEHLDAALHLFTA